MVGMALAWRSQEEPRNLARRVGMPLHSSRRQRLNAYRRDMAKMWLRLPGSTSLLGTGCMTCFQWHPDTALRRRACTCLGWWMGCMCPPHTLFAVCFPLLQSIPLQLGCTPRRSSDWWRQSICLLGTGAVLPPLLCSSGQWDKAAFRLSRRLGKRSQLGTCPRNQR